MKEITKYVNLGIDTLTTTELETVFKYMIYETGKIKLELNKRFLGKITKDELKQHLEVMAFGTKGNRSTNIKRN